MVASDARAISTHALRACADGGRCGSPTKPLSTGSTTNTAAISNFRQPKSRARWAFSWRSRIDIVQNRSVGKGAAASTVCAIALLPDFRSRRKRPANCRRASSDLERDVWLFRRALTGRRISVRPCGHSLSLPAVSAPSRASCGLAQDRCQGRQNAGQISAAFTATRSPAAAECASPELSNMIGADMCNATDLHQDPEASGREKMRFDGRNEHRRRASYLDAQIRPCETEIDAFIDRRRRVSRRTSLSCALAAEAVGRSHNRSAISVKPQVFERRPRARASAPMRGSRILKRGALMADDTAPRALLHGLRSAQQPQSTQGYTTDDGRLDQAKLRLRRRQSKAHAS